MKDRLTRMFSTKDASQRSLAAETNGTAKKSHDVTPSASSPPPTKTATAPQQRFVLLPEAQGGHEHHLKSSRRQEKLTDMIKSFLGGGRKPEQGQDHDLSLVSNWVDNLRKEKDRVSSDKKPTANPSATLAEKYGKKSSGGAPLAS